VHGGLGTDQVGEGFLMWDKRILRIRHRSHTLFRLILFRAPSLTPLVFADSLLLPSLSFPPFVPLHHPRRHKTDDKADLHHFVDPSSWNHERLRSKGQKR